MQLTKSISRAAGCHSAPRSAAPRSPPRARHGQNRRAVVAKDSKEEQQQQSVEDVLAAANALLSNLQSGEPVASSSPGVLASIDELQGLGYVCDESGCVLVLPGQQQEEIQVESRIGYLSGTNWSLGMLEALPEAEDGDVPTPYIAEISGPCWNIPLKPNELSDILGMLTQLRMMVANLSAQGQWLGGNGDRPISRVKRENNHIVMTASFSPVDPGFSLEMTFRTSRRSVTTLWPADVTAAVIVAMDKALGTTSPDSTGRFERVSATAATVSA